MDIPGLLLRPRSVIESYGTTRFSSRQKQCLPMSTACACMFSRIFRRRSRDYVRAPNLASYLPCLLVVLLSWLDLALASDLLPPFSSLSLLATLCSGSGSGQRRVAEGAAMLRTKGEAGTGNVVEAVRHARSVQKEIRMVRSE